MSGFLKVALVAFNSPGYQSLATGYLQAYAQACPDLGGRVGFQRVDMDTSVDPWWAAFRIAAMEADVVAVSVTCWNARQAYETCRVVSLARPGTTFVLGGPEVGPIAEEVCAAHPWVTAVVRGEGEVTFAELLGVLAKGGRPHRVDGVTARGDDGMVRSAPDRGLVTDLDALPSPYLTGVMSPVEGGAYLETYRGCPHRCGYCFEGKGYGRIRSFSEERIRAEVDAVASTVGTFSFIDPVFNLTDDRLRMLADALEPHARGGVRLHTIEVDIERVDDAAASDLRRAGVASVETGPQTVGRAALEACRRSFDRERFVAGVEACRRAGISVECDLIVGLPGDAFEDFAEGLRLVTEIDPGTVQTSTLHVLPGTDLWERADELGLAFDPEPPHYVVATASMGYLDLRRAEVLGAYVQSAYRARI